MVRPPFPRITYTEAVGVIQEAQRRGQGQGGLHPPVMKWGDDIGGDEETVLAKNFDRPHF